MYKNCFCNRTHVDSTSMIGFIKPRYDYKNFIPIFRCCKYVIQGWEFYGPHFQLVYPRKSRVNVKAND